MKKNFTLIVLLALSFTNLKAQCTPDTTITDLIVPPAGSQMMNVGGQDIVILPHGSVGQAYDEAMYFHVPADTTYNGVQATINYVKLNDVINLPSSLNVSCSTGNCQFPGDSFGCVSMTGIPTQPDSIELKMAIEYNITVNFGGSPSTTNIKDTLDGNFYLVIDGTVGMKELKTPGKPAQVYPNPATDKVNIRYNSTYGTSAQLEIFNIVGNKMYQQNLKLTGGMNIIPLDVSDLRSGIYMYTISTKNSSYTGRFTVSH